MQTTNVKASDFQNNSTVKLMVICTKQMSLNDYFDRGVTRLLFAADTRS